MRLNPLLETTLLGKSQVEFYVLSKGSKRKRVEELLQTLVGLGQARAEPGKLYGR